MSQLTAWGLWVLASTLGWAATGALSAYSGQLNSTLGLALVGLGQWTALRQWLRGGGVWVLVTYIAGFFGSMLGGALLIALGWSDSGAGIGLGLNALLWCVQGAAVGAGQALLLRNFMDGAGWWIAASAAGFLVASPLTQLVAPGALGLEGRILSVTLFGLVASAVSGLGLLRVRRASLE